MDTVMLLLTYCVARSHTDLQAPFQPILNFLSKLPTRFITQNLWSMHRYIIICISHKEFPQRVQHNVCNSRHKSQREDRFWRVSSKLKTTEDHYWCVCFRFVEMMLPPNANPMDAPTWFPSLPLLTQERSRNCLLSSLEDVLSVQPTDPLSKAHLVLPSSWMQQYASASQSGIAPVVGNTWQKLLSNPHLPVCSSPSISVVPPQPPMPLYVALNVNKHLNQSISRDKQLISA